ncbi:Leucine-rich repeat-containing protein 15-like protein [Leptotrombidium deliense]|uniref:Leucine-rich repeat-containing protein 15-like protein n=1 Tax=Leptotrombidium deliense TaxID=299467 RepID=A0A443SSP6_9ACAR|nr:Leucine-rich repeat-containing protein 15-like protein [Leptotrombidium deliense]
MPHVITIQAPPNNPNNLTIGRIFLDFLKVEEITIKRSNIPAIGDSSFWPGITLHLLNLSHNKIAMIKDSDFNGLSRLDVLNLSDNVLSTSPSAPFRFLMNLTRLCLARNQLTTLPPRFFLGLSKLQHLDLSSNPLIEVTPVDIRDIKKLKSLYLANCHLQRLHSLVYQGLPNLEELDLRNNRIASLVSDEFKHVKNLRTLLLDGNQLSVIVDYTFKGLGLKELGLSRNGLISLSNCAFCNSTFTSVDISRNKIASFHKQLLESQSNSLIYLNAEGNTATDAANVHNLIAPLTALQTLSIANMSIDDRISGDLFVKMGPVLLSLDISGNRIVNLSAQLLSPLTALRQLDLSSNAMRTISADALKVIDSMSSLINIYLHDNPWLCYTCFITPLLHWVSSNPRPYANVCRNGAAFCVRCSKPADIRGKPLDSVSQKQLESCVDPAVSLRVATSEPHVGLVLALLIIISLIIVIIVVVVMYRKQGAVYYTHEDDRLDEKTVFTIQSVAKSLATPPLSSPLSTSSSSPQTSPRLTTSTVPRPSVEFNEDETRPKQRI